ncbi:MAG: hypothetical protein J0L92_25075, partial [Deltaproteobacteria bacterium]|nr:hypothetical protein [Deltaproteobacteria bacterium]
MTRLALPAALLFSLCVALGPSVVCAQDTETPPGMSANRAQRAAPRTASAYDMGAARDGAVEARVEEGAEASSLSLGSVELDAPAGRADGVTLHRVGSGLMA